MIYTILILQQRNIFIFFNQENEHTMYFESDRSKSEFSMLCKDDGHYEFDNARENWPTCLQDVECPVPPEIPTSPEYTLKKVNFN